MTVGEDVVSAATWWRSRRRRYNVALLVAGAVAFLAYVAALQVRCTDDSEVEVTLFTMLVQGIGYLIAVGMANVCYALGPALERVVPATARSRYRRLAYTAGLLFSVVLPFVIPALILVNGCSPGRQ